MKRVLVLDALQRSALAVTRSLGSHGIPVITADESMSALAAASRHSSRYFSIPSPQSRPEEFVSRILEIIGEQDVGMVLPMTELTTTLLLKNRERMAGVTLPLPDRKSAELLANKCSLMRLARSLDIPFPDTVYVDVPGNLPVPLNELSYPLVLKPGKSWVEHNGDWLHTSVRFAWNEAEARSILDSDPAFSAGSFMLQENVPGTGRGIFALYDRDKPQAFFAHRRIREKPPSGGVSVLSESIEPDQALLDYSRKLLDAAGWHGIAMVEFRVSDEGTPWLMEVNTRFWGSLQLAVDAGVNFPLMLYQIERNESIEPADHYRKGKRLRWLLGDFDNLYLTLRDSNVPARNKVRAVARFLWPSPFRTRHETFRWTDPGPAWWEFRDYLKNLARNPARSGKTS